MKVGVCHDRRGAAARTPQADASAHGILGIKERVAVYGGTLTIGPGGGFDVEACVPNADEARG